MPSHSYTPLYSNPVSIRKKITLAVICSIVFIVGIVLISVGYKKYSTNIPSVPYFYSVNVCKLAGQQEWVGVSLKNGESCPVEMSIANKSAQTFHIPPNVMRPTVSYSPVFYVTNKVYGEIHIAHYVNGEDVLTADTTFPSGIDWQKFAVCGGKEITIFRNGPLEPVEGDYITQNCNNTQTGCKYEPARSLDKYYWNSMYLDLTTVPSEGWDIIVEDLWLKASSGIPVTTPEVYIYYELAGTNDDQDVGLILLVIGLIMADLMPAAYFFSTTRSRKPAPNTSDNIAMDNINTTNVSSSHGAVL